MADVFSIITTLQALEKAYIKDVVEAAEYEKQKQVQRKENKNRYFFSYTKNCEKLLAKFMAAYRQIEGEFPKIEDFVRKYRVKLCFVYVFGVFNLNF